MQVSFVHCDATHAISLPTPRPQLGLLTCPACRSPILEVDVRDARSWIDQQVERKRQLAQRGHLGTRKQSRRQSDERIDRDGLSAELAAAVILCPGSLAAWQRAAAAQKNNRGRDLLRSWTGLAKPVEVKQTRYQDAERGYLLVRPPRWTPGKLHREHIDDAIYVLMIGEPHQFRLAGWCDREHLLGAGKLNPVPVGPGQRESWGLHWSKLLPIQSLVPQIGSGGRLGAWRRWWADWRS